MTNGYKFDSITNTLTISKAFEKKASVLNSPEYRIIKQLRADYPNVQIERAKSESKASRKSITFAQMAAYIQIFDDENGATQKQFETVKAMAKIQTSQYKYVKTWFEGQFPNYTKQVSFDEQGKIAFAGGKAAEAAAV